MDIENKINYWLDMATYDLDTAKAMYNTKRYLYVGFMCHLVIEKSLKAYYWYFLQQEPPYTHNLLLLAKQCNLHLTMTKEMYKLIHYLMPLNIQARYPYDKNELMKSLNEKVCNDLLKQTEELFEWIKQLLKR